MEDADLDSYPRRGETLRLLAPWDETGPGGIRGGSTAGPVAGEERRGLGGLAPPPRGAGDLHSWLAERIEVLARDIYGELAYHPGTPPGVRQVLLRLADEEEHHAQRIRLLKATQRNSAWAEKALTASADPEVARLFQALARQDVWHRQLLERIRREAPQPATQGA